MDLVVVRRGATQLRLEVEEGLIETIAVISDEFDGLRVEHRDIAFHLR